MREIVIKFRATPDEFTALRTAAARTGLTLSELIRQAALSVAQDDAEPESPPKPKQPVRTAPRPAQQAPQQAGQSLVSCRPCRIRGLPYDPSCPGCREANA